MYLFHALVQENKINVHQAKRQAEVGEITRIVLVVCFLYFSINLNFSHK